MLLGLPTKYRLRLPVEEQQLKEVVQSIHSAVLTTGKKRSGFRLAAPATIPRVVVFPPERTRELGRVFKSGGGKVGLCQLSANGP